MSLIVLIKTREGYVLSGDSRLSFSYDRSKHTDSTYKVFCYDNRIGIAYHHFADINGKQLDVILDEFLKSERELLSPFDLACDLREYICKLKCNQNTFFYVFGYQEDECKKFYFNLAEDNKIYEYKNSRYVTGGQDDVALDIIAKTYNDGLSIEDAVIYIDKIFEETENVDDRVGGEIDLLHISPKFGARWLRRK